MFALSDKKIWFTRIMQLSIQLATTSAKCVLAKEDHNNENKGGLKLFHKDKQIALPQKAIVMERARGGQTFLNLRKLGIP